MNELFSSIALNSTPRFLNRSFSLWQAKYRSRRDTMGLLVGSPATSMSRTATHTSVQKPQAFVSFPRFLRFRVVIIGARMGCGAGWFGKSIQWSLFAAVAIV